LKPIDTSTKTLDIKRTSDTSVQAEPADQPKTEQPRKTLLPVDDLTPAATTSSLKASFRFGADIPALKAGDKIKVPVYVDATEPFQSAVLGLGYETNQLAITSVQYGDIFGTSLAGTSATPYLNQDGKMFVRLATTADPIAVQSGIIAYVEIQALADCKPALTFNKDSLSVLTAKGKNFAVNF
jgi:hypothetical protein